MTDFNITTDELKPYCEGFSAQQLEQARQICLEYRLSPIRRQIHIQKRNSGNNAVISPLVTIDGLRGIAERSDKYEGQVGPWWCGEDGKWVDVWLHKNPPLAARIGVHKKGFRDALYAVAKFSEYKAAGPLWTKMPDLMIAKCAEALALRRAFPDELSGLYTKEEMQQADNPANQVQGAKTADDVKAAAATGMAYDDEQNQQAYDYALGKINGCGDAAGIDLFMQKNKNRLNKLPKDKYEYILQAASERKTDLSEEEAILAQSATELLHP